MQQSFDHMTRRTSSPTPLPVKNLRPRAQTDSFVDTSDNHHPCLSSSSYSGSTSPRLLAIRERQKERRTSTTTSPVDVSEANVSPTSSLRRTLSSHGKQLFIGSYEGQNSIPSIGSPGFTASSPLNSPVGSYHGNNPFAAISSPTNKPRRTSSATRKATPSVVMMDQLQLDADGGNADDGWNTVPTKQQKVKQRNERKEYNRQHNIVPEPTFSRAFLMDSDSEDSDDDGDVGGFYYDEVDTHGRRQFGSGKKTNQFKAALKRSYAKEKRQNQRSGR